jgi:hypothetical protein
MAVWILIIVAIVAANLPWLSERFFLFFEPGSDGKRVWHRLLEWLFFYALTGGLALGLEAKTTGSYHSQDWEFYVATFCLFIIFALPGFIYRHTLKRMLERRRS